jgi:hypothetical protein
MDFITDLPESEGCKNMVVITDRLGKGVIADGLEALEAETVAPGFYAAEVILVLQLASRTGHALLDRGRCACLQFYRYIDSWQ